MCLRTPRAHLQNAPAREAETTGHAYCPLSTVYCPLSTVHCRSLPACQPVCASSRQPPACCSSAGPGARIGLSSLWKKGGPDGVCASGLPRRAGAICRWRQRQRQRQCQCQCHRCRLQTADCNPSCRRNGHGSNRNPIEGLIAVSVPSRRSQDPCCHTLFPFLASRGPHRGRNGGRPSRALSGSRPFISDLPAEALDDG